MTVFWQKSTKTRRHRVITGIRCEENEIKRDLE
jgi:hypothetical protein